MKPAVARFCFYCQKLIEEAEDPRFTDRVVLLNGELAHATCASAATRQREMEER
mgnify:CR=1 FL=1